ncbi:unnamed protein product, partial [Medioppia subpectinata]
MLTLFEGLAVGSLVGSAIFHLIPQSFNLTRDGSHAYLWKALIIFGGIYLFFWSERIMKMVVEFRRKRKLNVQSVPSCTSAELEPHRPIPQQKHVYFKDFDYDKHNGVVKSTDSLNNIPETTSHDRDLDNERHKSIDNESTDSRSESLVFETIARERSRSNSFSLRHGHSHGTAGEQRVEIATVAWMIIFGDGLHNFIDGITIGA